MTRHPLRVIGRLSTFGLVCAGALLDFAWIALRNGRAPNHVLRAGWSQHWGRAFLKVLRIEVDSQGCPPSSGVLVCNHLGYLDIVVLAALHPQVFVSKSEVRHWPAIGWLARCAGTLFINRSRKSDVKELGNAFERVVNGGVVLTLFPESTSSDGHAVLPFHSPLFQPAALHGWPVTGAWIGYTLNDGCVEEEVCYWRDMTFLPHFLNLLSKESIRARVVFGEPAPAGLNRKEMAAALWEQVSQLARATRTPGETNPALMRSLQVHQTGARPSCPGYHG